MAGSAVLSRLGQSCVSLLSRSRSLPNLSAASFLDAGTSRRVAACGLIRSGVARASAKVFARILFAMRDHSL